MKYELTPSITAKCGLLTHKVNFVVTTAFRYALRATYFITQRAETHLSGATQRKSNLSTAFARRGIKRILLDNMVNAIVSHIKSLRSKQGLRLCSLRRNSEGL